MEPVKINNYRDKREVRKRFNRTTKKLETIPTGFKRWHLEGIWRNYSASRSQEDSRIDGPTSNLDAESLINLPNRVEGSLQVNKKTKW